jgi:hypothetical protein
MKNTAFAFALILGLAAGPAFASQCPAMMAQIDEALQTAELSEADEARVMELRQQGEEEHNAGNHAASEASLGEAMEILGIN